MPKSPAKPKSVSRRRLRFGRYFIGREAKEYFLENLGMQVSSGMGVAQALGTLGTDLRSRSLRNLIADMQADIEAGQSLSAAVSSANFMSADVVALLRIGEESGRLAENISVIVIQQQKRREFRSRIRSAMLYPVFVLGITVVVGVTIAWFILPQLADVFGRLDVELPLITSLLIQLGAFLSDYGKYVIPGLIALLAVALYFSFLFKPTRFIGQWFLLHVPGVKKLLIQVELGRMGYVLGTLLQAGLPIVEAIDSLAKATTLRRFEKFYQYLKTSTESGEPLRVSFASYPRLHRFIPSSVQQMIVAAEQSGHLADILVKVGQTFEEKTENTTKNLSVILEPLLLVVVWSGVVLVALAVVLPVYSLIGGL